MDKLNVLGKKLGESRAQIAEVQQKFREGSISPEEAVHESMKVMDAVGEAIREARKQD